MMNFLKKNGFFLLALLLVGLYAGSQWLNNSTIEQITVSDLEEVLQSNRDDYVVIDVREAHEYANGHVPDSTNLPLSQLESLLLDVPKDKEIFVICQSGKRSMEASHILHDNGFEQIKSVNGGMNEWQGAIER